ncbi:MAG: acyltransferase [Candidatus Methanoperedens sp.]|nr:acyltransferase [Candidatus Methanoperedens sp.]
MFNSNYLFKLYVKFMRLRFFKLIILTLRGEAGIETLINLGLKVGSNCDIQPGVKIDESHCWLIEIGNNVTLAPRVMILAHDASMKRHLGYTKIGKVNIGNKVFIGAGTIVLPNVSIGKNSIIGAGSVVTKDIPENVVATGNPAKVLCSLEEFLIKHHEVMRKSPLFGDEFTINRNVNNNKKNEMNNVIDGVGYIL